MRVSMNTRTVKTFSNMRKRIHSKQATEISKFAFIWDEAFPPEIGEMIKQYAYPTKPSNSRSRYQICRNCFPRSASFQDMNKRDKVAWRTKNKIPCQRSTCIHGKLLWSKPFTHNVKLTDREKMDAAIHVSTESFRPMNTFRIDQSQLLRYMYWNMNAYHQRLPLSKAARTLY